MSDAGTGVSANELKRRLVHASGSALPLAYAVGPLPWGWLKALLLGLSALVTVLEVVRLVVGLDWAIYEELTREYEQTNVAGYALYVYSMTAVAFAFAPHVAIPGMLMLTIGDPISGLLGSNTVGETKQVTTLLAMFGVCVAIAFPFLSAVTTTGRAALAAVAGALGATLADGVKPVIAGYVVDDNLSIPPTACIGMAFVLRFLG